MPTRTPVGIRVLEATRGRGRCRGCSAPLVWFETQGGMRIPFNEGYRVDSSEILQLAEGGRGVIATISSAYAHWATCPVADQFRKRKRGHA